MAGIIFFICLVLFIIDIIPPATVTLAGCVAYVVFDICSLQEAFSGFANDITLIVFGTEIFGIAFHESGLSRLTAKKIIALSKGKEKRIIIFAGLIAAALSAFLNNQVVCSLMLVICISISQEIKNIKVKNITLPVIYLAILGGQCTLVGAPATLIASSISEKITGKGIAMFELLPIGLIILAVSLPFILFFSYRTGNKIWGSETSDTSSVSTESLYVECDKRKCIVTASAGIVMLILFITGIVSVGIASVIGAIICIVGGAVKQHEAFSKVDWNILIWLACSIGMANALNSSGCIQELCEKILSIFPNDISPMLLLSAVIVLTVAVSNVISNTTTVILILPFAIQFAQQFGFNERPFIIAVALASGFAILTPISCGFIGMTMRLGYRFKDYVKYGLGIQIILVIMMIVLIRVFYAF